jgi:hypothetical protein
VDAKHKPIRAAIRERQAAPVPVSIAASLVYFELRHSSCARDRDLERSLNDAALALAQIADIYYENESGHVLRIPDSDLQDGRFEGGAKLFRSSGGQTFQGLTMRRIDVMYAMEVLGKAHDALNAINAKASAKRSDSPVPGGPESETPDLKTG